MLELSRPLPISSHCCPVIRPRNILLNSLVDHRLDGEDMPCFHEPSGLVVAVMRDVGGTMEEVADSMSAVSSVDRQPK